MFITSCAGYFSLKLTGIKQEPAAKKYNQRIGNHIENRSQRVSSLGQCNSLSAYSRFVWFFRISSVVICLISISSIITISVYSSRDCSNRLPMG